MLTFVLQEEFRWCDQEVEQTVQLCGSRFGSKRNTRLGSLFVIYAVFVMMFLFSHHTLFCFSCVESFGCATVSSTVVTKKNEMLCGE